jgi:hypothetical protein
MKKIRAQRRTSATNGKKACGVLWILIIYAAFLLGAISSMVSTSTFTASISSLQNGSLSTLDGTNSVLKSFVPAINNAFHGVKVLVNSSVDTTLNAINFDALQTTGLIPNFNTLAVSMDDSQSGINALKESGVSVKTTKLSLSALVATLADGVGHITGNISAWTSVPMPVPGSSNITYFLSTAVAVPNVGQTATEAKTNINSASDGSSTFSSLDNSPNLTKFANEIRDIIKTLQVNMSIEIAKGGNDVKVSTAKALNEGQATAVKSIEDVQGPLSTQVSGYRNLTSTMLDMILVYDVYRVQGVWGLSALILIILIVLSIGMCAGKPSAVKGCNLCASPIYLLIMLMALLFFLIALVLGDVCTNVFETTPSPIATALGSDGAMINNIFVLRNNCSSGASILQAAEQMGYLTSDTSLSTQANKQINNVNFSKISDGFNLDNMIDLSNSPTSQLSTLTSLNLSTLNTTQLDTMRFTTLPLLSSQLVNVSTSLTTLNSSLTATLLTFTPTGQVYPVTANAVADLQSRITSVVAIITTIVANGTGTIPSLITQVTYMSGNITVLKSQASTLITTANNIPGYYNMSIDSLHYFANNATKNVLLMLR